MTTTAAEALAGRSGAAGAQLAALREALEDTLGALQHQTLRNHPYDPDGCSACQRSASELGEPSHELADTAQAAQEHDERVAAEERERVIRLIFDPAVANVWPASERRIRIRALLADYKEGE